MTATTFPTAYALVTEGTEVDQTCPTLADAKREAKTLRTEYGCTVTIWTGTTDVLCDAEDMMRETGKTFAACAKRFGVVRA